ncbi:DUF6582 domain-containing protein [Streptacidiphilus sp. EB129]|uniref:DUF6582 domain-containing protein n=1 Tax=Streptacidiphilus sp. EB129 TaxID=3156262 RepID=UPI0035133049
MAMTTMKPFSGTFLYPGVSLNGCLYTRELIGKAVTRMQERIADPDGLPIVMRTHHKAGDNSRLIVGRVISAQQAPDGSAKYEARWYDTAPARDIAALVQPADGGPPGLKSVSIHGYFLGETTTVNVDGQQAQTASDLEIDAIDFTATPGVVQALIDSPGAAPPSESAPAVAGRTPISETWEVPVATVITEEAATPTPEAAAQSSGPWADPGYQKDKQKRYDLSTKVKAKAAWSYVHQPDNARLYTSKQLKNIKGRIIKALKAFGVTISAESWLIETAAPVTESLAECWDMERTGGDLYISLTNGPTTVSVTSRLLDAHDLEAVGLAAMAGACDTLTALDPDLDDDIDVTGAPAEDTDNDQGDDEPEDQEDPDMADEPQPGSGCPCGCGCSVPHQMAGGPGCPCPCGDCEVCNSTPTPADETAPAPAPQLSAPVPAAEPAPTVKESAVTDVVTPAAETAAPATPAPTTAQSVQPLMVTLTQEQFAQLLGQVAPAPVAETAPAPVAETAPAAAVEAPAPAEAAPAAPVAAAPMVAETYTKAQLDEAVAAGAAQAVKALIPEIAKTYGLPPRRGFRTTESDHGDAKPKTGAEMWDDRADLLLGDFGKIGI